MVRDIFVITSFKSREFEEFKYLLKQIVLNAVTNRLDFVKEIINENLIRKEPELDLGNCFLTSLYEVNEVFKNVHLEKLILSNEWAERIKDKWHKIQSINKGGKNSIGEIPLEIQKFKKLKILIAGGDWNTDNDARNNWHINDLTVLKELNELEYLNVSNNKICIIPRFDKLIKLKVLHLNNNKINLAHKMNNLELLEEIYLSNNRLTRISFLQNLQNVKTIDLHANRIKDLTLLDKLIEKLDITNSKWEQNTINIAKNPLENPPIEIINTGKKAVLNYFNEISIGKAFVNKEVKLILVGNSEVGKTTLAKYLNDEKDLDKIHIATQWLEEYPVLSKSIIDKIKEKCTINLFDFGGHDYFHDTHHLFYSSNTIYILLWDKATNKLYKRTTLQTNKKDEVVQVQTQDFPLKYWLDSIKHFIKEKKTENFKFEIDKPDEYNSQVLVIQNKVSNVRDIDFLNQNEIIKDYPFIYDFINISIINPRRNLECFDALLVEILNGIPIIGARLPGYYGTIKKNVKTYKGKPIVTISEFRTYCNSLLQINITLEQTIFLANYLKQIGQILYYPKGNDDDRLYINKNWVIKQIHSILDDLALKNGEFDENYLIEKLNLMNTLEQRNSIIELMIDFKMIFKHPSSDTFIAPLYLPAEPIQSVDKTVEVVPPISLQVVPGVSVEVVPEARN